MKRFYCQMGDFKRVVWGEDEAEATGKALLLATSEGWDTGLLMSISRKGYDDKNPRMMPVRPVLKILGIKKKRPTKKELAELGLGHLDKEQLKWLLG